MSETNKNINAMDYYNLLSLKRFDEAKKFLYDNSENDDLNDEIYDVATESEFFVDFIFSGNLRAAFLIFNTSFRDNDNLCEDLRENIDDIIENANDLKYAKYFYKKYIEMEESDSDSENEKSFKHLNCKNTDVQKWVNSL